MGHNLISCSSEVLPKVLVLMATYNGEKYLSQQIDSILNQKNVDVTLLICDDCSSDGSFRIAQNYSHDDARVVSKRNVANVGVGMNFMNMLYDVDTTQFDFVAFSDQDDVWLDDKLSIACKAISSKTSKPSARLINPFGVPVLYCSDLQNVDKNLDNPVWELRALGLNHDKRAIPLIRNYYAGCTMVMNISMVELVQSYKLNEVYRIHDAWLALIARYCGNLVIDLDNARILRRITGNNVVGVNSAGGDFANASFSHLAYDGGSRYSKAAWQLYLGFGRYMSPGDRDLVKSFATYKDSLIRRIAWIIRTDYCVTTITDSLLYKIKFLIGRY